MLEDQTGTPSNPSPAGSLVFNNKTRLLLLALVMGLALAYLVYAAFPGNTRYYLTVDEFLADEQDVDGKSFRVVGKLVPDSFQRTSGTVRASFAIADQGAALNATYDGVLPDLFFNPHSDIVLEGTFGEEVFHTEAVIVKCPSKYQALEEEA